MNEFDLEHLGDVWRRQLNPAELEELRRSADAVRQRARGAHVVDVVSALLVAGVLILLVLSNPRIDTAIVASAAILAMLVNHRRQRRLRQLELRSLSGSTEEMLDQSIARIEATLKRNQFQLILIGPGIVFGLVVAHFALLGTEGRLPMGLGVAPTIGKVLVALGAAGLVGMAIHLFHVIRRSRQERDRLITLRNAYREERESTRP